MSDSAPPRDEGSPPDASSPAAGDGGEDAPEREPVGEVTLLLGGDVMIGRGIDQAMPRSTAPDLHEPFVRSARRYLELAIEASGPIPEPLEPGYVWGDALELLTGSHEALCIVNLETAVTDGGRPWEGKGIHYRTHPANVEVLAAAGVDCCVLANNHALDWGREALVETVEHLRDAGIAVAGAGRDATEAAEAPVLEAAGGTRVAVHAFASPTSGVPVEWRAAADRPGVRIVDERQPMSVGLVRGRLARRRNEADLHLVSIHWGGNWGWDLPRSQRRMARALVEEGEAAVIHGHSSHHPKGMEVRAGRPILYGCGDLLNDYEGIAGRERFRGELVVLYEVVLRTAGPGALSRLRLRPFRLRRFRLERPSPDDVEWLRRTLDREGKRTGTEVSEGPGATLEVRRADDGPDGSG